MAIASQTQDATWRRSSRSLREARRLLPIYLLILPGMLLFIIWTLYPLLDALVMSFTTWNPRPGADSPFVGLANYQQAFQDPVFWQAFGNVILYALGTVPVKMALGLALAILLNRKMAARNLFRTLFYLPVVTSWVVVSFIFQYLFTSPSGLVDWFFGSVLHLIPSDQIWLGSPTWALPTLMILDIWKGVGWTMVIWLAALQGIPAALYEAAQVDGATIWGQFRYVTLPLLRSTASVVSVMQVLGAFSAFISMFILTQGGPEHATETLLTYAYSNAFSNFQFGYGAAVSYLFAVFVFAFSLLQLRLIRRDVEY